MNLKTFRIALLLFGSGACALIYQMAWLRELRLVFGASTAASAAVLGIFMGGLGLGSWALGSRADRQARPLLFYAKLEGLIAASAAVTPLLLFIIRKIYIATGGSTTLGLTGATVVRLLLAGLVLLVPTFLMGGTLPAAGKAASSARDVGRRGLALLYGVNTLGAVFGSVLATFFLLELLGARRTLWLACVLNGLVAFIGYLMSKPGDQGVSADAADEGEPRAETVETNFERAAPAAFVLAASACVGFAFLLMELVWYRMLSPILGGSTFTFGLILAMALLGIGIGGAGYALFRSDKPATLRGFALTCALEALCIAIPYALGDRLAILALLLRSLNSMGFYGLTLGWSIVTSVVVLPAAIVSGAQFPMLIALLGRGRAAMGRQVGMAYSYNTLGAIVGSLAGGFGLLPLLTAPGAWRLVVFVLAGLAAAAILLDLLKTADLPRLVPAALAAAVALLLVSTAGPTAAWRHSGIGAGRSDRQIIGSPNSLHAFINEFRRSTAWKAEGVESSVAVLSGSGYSFWVNGKNDGNARTDAGTQVVGGLIGAILHPNPKRAMVVGLGTGSTAGWLGAIPSMERVDVAELEPAILHVAELCAPVNQSVRTNPKVHVSIGDARELLLTTPNRYDVIFSEPSNPYRAGVASLYTREFYDAAAQRLNTDGIFMQWVQAYEVDGRTLRIIYATMTGVFDEVETWQSQMGDLILVATRKPIAYDAGRLRARVAESPYREALLNAWRVTDLEGFLAHHVANTAIAKGLADVEYRQDPTAPPSDFINTDDRNLVEFAFARSVGTTTKSHLQDLIELARQQNQQRPRVEGGEVDWESVEDQRLQMFVVEEYAPPLPPASFKDRLTRAQALAAFVRGDARGALETWRRQPKPPTTLTELSLWCTALADAGSDDALPYIERLRGLQPIEADAMTALLRLRQKKPLDALAALQSAFTGYRTNPWPQYDLMSRTLGVARTLALSDFGGGAAIRVHALLQEPFAVSLSNDARLANQVKIAEHIEKVIKSDKRTKTIEAIKAMEPNVPWNKEFLDLRYTVYRDSGDPRAELAGDEYNEFLRRESPPLIDSAVQSETAPTTLPANPPVAGPTADSAAKR